MPPRPATWCSRRCTPSTPRKPSTASSRCSRRTSRSRSACSWPWCSRPPSPAPGAQRRRQGRVPAVEVLVATPFIKDCIVDKDKTHLIPGRDRPGHVAVRDADLRPVDLQPLLAQAHHARRSAALGLQRRRVQAQGPGHLHDGRQARDQMASAVFGKPAAAPSAGTPGDHALRRSSDAARTPTRPRSSCSAQRELSGRAAPRRGCSAAAARPTRSSDAIAAADRRSHARRPPGGARRGTLEAEIRGRGPASGPAAAPVAGDRRRMSAQEAVDEVFRGRRRSRAARSGHRAAAARPAARRTRRAGPGPHRPRLGRPRLRGGCGVEEAEVLRSAVASAAARSGSRSCRRRPTKIRRCIPTRSARPS